MALLRLDRGRRMRANLAKAGRTLAGFAKALRLKYKDIEVSTDFEPEHGLADSGDLDTDLTDLLAAVANAAHEYRTAVVLFIDELQYVHQDQLASLIRGLHSAGQRQLPITMLAADLPQLIGQMGRAKSYAERLFEFVPIDRLDEKAASAALRVPAEKESVVFAQDAIAEILHHTMGYPYFLQEWGRHAWNAAESSPISRTDARRATSLALAELDAGFFRVRFDRLTPMEKRYLRAMAELGTSSLRGCRRATGEERDERCSDAKRADRERHGLQPRSRRYGVHCSALRRLHEKNHARAASMTSYVETNLKCRLFEIDKL